MAATKTPSRHLLRRRQARPPMTWRQRERLFNRLGYRALAIGFNKAHLGDGWLRHFGAKADHFFHLALEEWRHAQES
nr:hypothetical protein [Dechloromonas sp.]